MAISFVPSMFVIDKQHHVIANVGLLLAASRELKMSNELLVVVFLIAKLTMLISTKPILAIRGEF